jgi:hypothetical protein
MHPPQFPKRFTASVKYHCATTECEGGVGIDVKQVFQDADANNALWLGAPTGSELLQGRSDQLTTASPKVSD